MIRFKISSKHGVRMDADLGLAQAALEQVRRSKMAGWLAAPVDAAELEQVHRAAEQIQQQSQYLVCIGIGGSYLGHRAMIEALSQTRSEVAGAKAVKVLYAGQNLSTLTLRRVLAEIGDTDWSINVISKSGTTIEPAVAFRVLRAQLVEKYGPAQAAQRIYATTDAHKGALHDEAVKCGYTQFAVPDGVGGRYSVLTPVGLLPMAAAGIDIDAMLGGARKQAEHPEAALEYATYRQQLHQRGFDTEVLTTFEPDLHYFAEWWKQLFGESEGKDGGGLFPASITGTTDLHSLGQYLQQGRGDLLETFLNVADYYREYSDVADQIVIKAEEDDADGINYLGGHNMAFVNAMAYSATVVAHAQARPVAEIQVPELSAKAMGALIQFFEIACAVSATLQGVNPFDQPGVEAYKTEMYKRLGKGA